jgi:hypothetical protein
MSQPSDKISSDKAKEMLRDGEAHGHALSDAQKGMLGAAAGRQDHDHDGGVQKGHPLPGLEAKDGVTPEPGLNPDNPEIEEKYSADLHTHMHKHYPHSYSMHDGFAKIFGHHP